MTVMASSAAAGPRENDPPIRWAEYYLSLGWVLSHFPSGTKGPQTKAWNTPAAWIDTPARAAAHWRRTPTSGMGLIHGPSQTMALDLDDVARTRALCQEFGLDLDKLLLGAPRSLGKPGRDKAFFRLPESGVPPMHRIAWKHPTDPAQSLTLCEFRTGPVHDCLPPSQHPDGHRYAWRVAPWELGAIPVIPAELLAFWAELPALKPQLDAMAPWAAPATYSLPASRGSPRASGSNGTQGNVIGQCNAAYDVRSILKAHGYIPKGNRFLAPTSTSGIPGVVILEDKAYSHHAGDVLADGHAHDAFDLLRIFDYAGDQTAAVRAMALELGMAPFAREWDPAPLQTATIDVDALLAPSTSAPAARRTAAADLETSAELPAEARAMRPVFPVELLEVPGLVGRLAAYINRTALYPQPILALAASIAAAGTLMGRKVRTETDLRTNLYVLGVAESGAGKEHARQAIRTVFDHAGAFRRVSVEGLASDAALNTALEACPSSLFLLDEIGRFLAVLTDARASAHLSEIVTQLLKIYSAATGPYCGKVYADADRAVIIHQPCLSLYGTTAPSAFHNSLSPAQIEDGFLSRLLVFESEDGDPEPQAAVLEPPPQALIESCVAWEQMPEHVDAAHHNVAAVTRPEPRILPPDPKARLLFGSFERAMRANRRKLRAAGKPAALYVRTAATAQKLGLIVAAGRDPEQPVITEEDAAWGCALAEYLANAMAWRVLAFVSENNTERATKRLLAMLDGAGARGLSRTELTRKTQWLRSTERNDILATLSQSGEIAARRVTTAGRSGERYLAVQYLPATDAEEPDPAAAELQMQ